MEVARWNKQTLFKALSNTTKCEQDVLPFFMHNFKWDFDNSNQNQCVNDSYFINDGVIKISEDSEFGQELGVDCEHKGEKDSCSVDQLKRQSQFLKWSKYIIDFATNVVVIDSREITKNNHSTSIGCIFVALPGNNYNGSDFAINALENGASICIVEQVPSSLPAEYRNRIIVVKNTHLALVKMAIYARNNTNATFICITGSCGKTTTKEMVRLALQEIATHVHATIGNYNNHYGLSLTLANLPPQTQYSVLELGMNGPGEISILSKIARPDIAIITGIYNAHSEYFTDIQGIAHAKAEICDGISSGVIIINADIDEKCYDILVKKAQKCNTKVISYGSKKADKNIDITLDGVKPMLNKIKV